MPFTLSHAAAALPFQRTRLVMSALVFGCFAPDFEYFLGHHGAFGHTLKGMFLFDLPLAFAALWLFHHYAREPLAACLPQGARERLPRYPRSLSINSFSRFAMIVLSILVGIATHILWDSFTHTRTWPYYHWPLLSQAVRLPLFGPRQWCDIFQYISSVLGLVIILLWFVHWYRITPPAHPTQNRRKVTGDRIALASAFGIALVIALIRAAATGMPHGGHGFQRVMTVAVITAMTVFWIEVLVYGVVRSHSRSTITPA
jgi:Domain of unknown function (DUF4184)